MHDNSDLWDAVIIGGGPAGSTTGALLAQAGRRVALFERAQGPRFHIGESLQPMTYWTLQRLGVLERLKQSSFPRKYSVQFFTHDGKTTRPFYFFLSNPHESAITWQVWRADFDEMLLTNAQQKGCHVQRGAHVTDVMFDGQRAVGVRVRLGDADPIDVRARVVVDASGQSSILANRLRLRVTNEQLRQASIWSYFRGARRDPGIDGGATLIFSTRGKHAWFWFIPLPDEITSVGVVSSLDFLLGDGAPTPDVFDEQLEECPRLKERLADAQRVQPFRVTRDYSYMTSRGAGDGWVLVGDAFGFIDPIYSTGLLLALKSGELAADAILDGLRRDELSAEQLGRWQADHRRAVAAFRKLVYAFYSYEFSFGRFIREYPHHYQNLVDLLIGDVYKEGVDAIFTDLGEPLPYDGSPPTRQSTPTCA
jgi:flavin-dependent dehydrogenase